MKILSAMIAFPCLLYLSACDANTVSARSTLSHCGAVQCPELHCRPGQTPTYVGPEPCCKKCVSRNIAVKKRTAMSDRPEKHKGQCKVPADCKHLIHIQCVGQWSCINEKCVYRCTSGKPVLLKPGG